METPKLTPKEEKARKRVCLALDVDSVQKGLDLVEELSPFVGLFKINSLYHTAVKEKVDIIEEIQKRGGETFLDLKFHDTPQTVYNYALEFAIPGVRIFNLHISGSKHMCEKAMEGAHKGAKSRGIERPKVIGVTELTSLSDWDLEEQWMNIKYDQLVMRRTELARKWGLDGVVCPANKAGVLEREAHERGLDKGCQV